MCRFLRSRDKTRAKTWIIFWIMRFSQEAVKTVIFESDLLSVRTIFAQNGCIEFRRDDLLVCVHRGEQDEQVRCACPSRQDEDEDAAHSCTRTHTSECRAQFNSFSIYASLSKKALSSE